MTAITQTNGIGLSIEYNGIHFGVFQSLVSGGGSVELSSTPPECKLRGQIVYDDTHRTVKGVRYVLAVNSIFHSASSSGMYEQIELVRRLLAEPRKRLIITALAFGGLFNPFDSPEWGPKPLSFDWAPLGQLAWQCAWSVEFFVEDQCERPSYENFAIAAFNFDTTWTNDYEGLSTRTISGHAEIPTVLEYDKKTPKYTVDALRDTIKIICPTGFRRVNNVWRENAEKNRLEFMVVDQRLPGQAPPEGCISAHGEVSFQSVAPKWNQALVTLSMMIRTSPHVPSSLAGIIFLQAAKAKAEALNRSSGISSSDKATVVPHAFMIKNGKYDDARTTMASMSWIVTKSAASLLSSAGIWQPITTNDYTRWRYTIEDLWGNRGTYPRGGAAPRNNPREGAVISVCEHKTSVTIGDTTGGGESTPEVNPDLSFACPNIPPDGGWIEHDVRLRLHREDRTYWHQKAVSYNPDPGSAPDQTPSSSIGERVQIGGPSYSVGTGQEADAEYQGLPTVYVALQFRGLRAQHKPVMPELKSVDGHPAYFEYEDIDGPRLAFDAPCPVWFVRGYRIYRINGVVTSVKATESNISAAAPGGNIQVL